MRLRLTALIIVSLERVMRAKVAAGIVARQRHGRIMWLTTSQAPLAMLPMPITGSHPRLTLKVRTSIRPSQKMGTETPTSASTMKM